VDELLKRGYKLPFYADLTSMPELERKAIWGMMVGEEGKTKIPVLSQYTEAGFDPSKDMLQSYGEGWKSATFLPDERQLFGLPGGILNDWHLRTNLEGLYAAGDQLFASNCHGHAAATGHYAGRHAAVYSRRAMEPVIEAAQLEKVTARLLAPIRKSGGLGWKELAYRVSRLMQKHCGETKSGELLGDGLEALKEVGTSEAPELTASNPHELMRSLESLNVLANAELVLNACRARKASSKQLNFHRSDYPQVDPPEWHKFLVVRNTPAGVKTTERPIDYYGPLEANYEAHNEDYFRAHG
jgi:succinate dehydrogenase/fumarate reductase flavoprotein subunit